MSNRFARLLALFAALGLLIFGVNAQPPLPLPGGSPVHALTLNADASGLVTVAGYTTTFVRVAPVSQEITRFVEAIQAAQDNDYDIVTVQLMDDASGAVVFQTTVTVARWLRGEFAIDPGNLAVTGPNGSNIAGTVLPWQDRTFSVKVPIIPGANRLAVALPSTGRSSDVIDLAAVASQFGTRGLRDVTLIPLSGYDNGDPVNRLDVVILGDGYTAAQQGDFAADAQALADGLFDFVPYSRYRKYFNVVGVFGESAESGADQPVCADPDPPMSGQMKDTRYDSTYCFDGIARLLVATDYPAIYDDADAGYPNWDEIFVIVNDTTYGGSGGALATVSKNSFGVQILQHEVGHSLVRLDDEYDTFTPGYPPCSDKNRNGITTPCRPNVTDQTSRALIKWSRWVSPSTPVPTTSALGADIAGLWLGAHYQPTIYYRPCYNCTMRSLGTPFGPVQSEQLPIVLYSGGWEGQSSYWESLGSGTGIDIVEPGTIVPDPSGGTVNIPSAQSQTFSFTVLSPSGGDNARVKWKVNDTLVKDSQLGYLDTAEFVFTPISAGNYVVSAEVTDTGGVLHSTQTSVSKTTLTWQVSAEGYSGVGTELLANGSFEVPKPSNPKQPDQWKAVSATKSKIKCDADPVFVAFDGSCAYLMQGVNGTTAMLKQTATAIGDAGDAFSVSGHFDTMNLKAAFVVQIKFVYANGTEYKLKLQQLPRDQAKSEPYFAQETSHVLGMDAPDVSQIKVQVKFPNPGGKVYVDALSLLHFDEYLTSPPPPAGERLRIPPAFRGSN